MKMTLNELKIEIAEILQEAKKKKEKAEKIKEKGASVEAYGLYDEAFDFSAPLGGYNLYKQQGAANWGPYTSAGPQIDSTFASPGLGTTELRESEEQALRALVREVIENGLIPPSSAWAPMLEKSRSPGTAWESAQQLFEAWYDREQRAEKKDDEEPKGSKAKGHEKTEYGAVKKHGQPKKSRK